VTIGNSSITNNYFTGNIRGGAFIKTGGTSSEFLKADGSVDSSTYLTTGSAASTYLPLTGGTLTGNLTLTASPLSIGAGNGLLLNNPANSQYYQIYTSASNELNFGYGGTTPIVAKIGSTGAVTLTGALNGTSASFSSSLQTGGDISLMNASGDISIRMKDSGGNADRVLLRQGTTNNVYLGDIDANGGKAIIRANGEDYLTILTTGNVGIGTPSPYGKLQVSGGHLVIQGNSTAGTDGTGDVRNAGFAFRKPSSDLISALINTTDVADWGMNMHFFTRRFNATMPATPAMTISSESNVGIGTASPYALLSVYSGTAGDRILIDSSTGSGSNGAIAWGAGGTPNISARIKGIDDGFFGTHLIFETRGSSGPALNTIERMRITSGGYLKASNTGSYANSTGSFHELNNNVSFTSSLQVRNTHVSSPAGQDILFTASPNNTSSAFLYCADGTEGKFVVFSNGDVDSRTNSYGGWSDIKLKENIIDASPKLEDLLKVKVKNYNFIGDDKKQLGVIAQELEEIFPALVSESPDFEEVEVPQLDEEGNEILNEEGEVVTSKEKQRTGTTTKSVKYSVFVPMLIKAIQEQQEIINEMKAEIDSLKNQIK
jgi:hypothetical protein